MGNNGAFSLLFCLQIVCCNSARILFVVPTPSYSHQIFFRPIVLELLNRGHEVTYITTNPMNVPNQTNLTEIDLSVTFKELLFKTTENYNIIEGSQNSIVRDNIDKVSTCFDNAFQNQELQNLVKNEKNDKFDIVIVEWIFTAYATFSYIYDCPLIGIQPMINNYVVNEHFSSSLSPLLTFDYLYPSSHPMTLRQRISYLFHFFNSILMYRNIDKITQNWMEKHFQTKGILFKEMSKKMNILLRNNHPAFSGAHVEIPGVIDIGGISKMSLNPLPLDLQSYLDNATEGVIYISFGTNVQSASINVNQLQVFLETFKVLPYKILWKWDLEVLPKQFDNIFVRPWLPQNDVLHHPNIKCFITHGGLQSIEQAIYARVPLIGIPFFGDQHYNVHRIHELQIGIKQQYNNLNTEDFTHSILTVVRNPVYKENIIKLSHLYDDQIVPPVKKAVWWIEHTIRQNGSEYTRSSIRDFQPFEIFLMFILVFVVIVVLLLTYVIRYVIINFLTGL